VLRIESFSDRRDAFDCDPADSTAAVIESHLACGLRFPEAQQADFVSRIRSNDR
jgi:hypothetical protein